MDRIESYKEVGDQYILEQYKNSSRLRGVIDALLAQCNDLESAFFEILGSIDLQTAIGPALDYLGEIVGVIRKPRETDEEYRTRIYQYQDLHGAPTYEGVRKALKLLTGQHHIGLYPDWPASLYWVPSHSGGYDPVQLTSESLTSGASLVKGTYLVGEINKETGEFETGILINEDNGQPLVVDQHFANDVLISDENEAIIDDSGNVTIGLYAF